MTQMIPEALPVRVDVTPVAYIDVVVEGPGGLKATLHIPDGEEVWDVLDEFVAALPQAIVAGMRDADERANGRGPVEPKAAWDA